MRVRVCKLVCAKQRCCEGAAYLPLWRGINVYCCVVNPSLYQRPA